jgi:predicted dehydrogenase
MTDPVRIGILGSGFIADFYLANYSRSAERGAALAARYGIARTYDTIEGLCADEDVDIVIVALPNHLHLDAVRAATANGRAVVCTRVTCES